MQTKQWIAVTLLGLLAMAVEGFAGAGSKALVQEDNPAATYMAILPLTIAYNYGANGTNSTSGMNSTNTTRHLSTRSNSVTGFVTGMANLNGTGVRFFVNFAGFESDSGPYTYEIHDDEVSEGGDCSTSGRLDPTWVGELAVCSSDEPEACQAGDLAGKHGQITGNVFTASYLEPYLSTDPESPYFFGDKSVVISSGTGRVSCANFKLISATAEESTSSETRRRRRSG